MGKTGLQIKCNLENITDLKPTGDDFRWHLKFKCSNCGEETPKVVYVCLEEKTRLKGGRGEANLVTKCKFCSRENSIEIIKDSLKPYTFDDNEQFKTVVAFDCRGCEPTEFSFRNGFAASGLESGKPFDDINLEENEWVDYDDKANVSVGIYEASHKFIKM
ncbi:UPF0587 protein [Halotydeus destructor]|nr:UPF0587 protein [Halotydeus destructor]